MAEIDTPVADVIVDEPRVGEPQTEAEASASFAEGFAEEIATETGTQEVLRTDAVVVETPAPDEVTVPPEPEVAYAKITDAQFAQVLRDLDSVKETRSSVEKVRGDVFGKLGGIERTLKALQESTPVGQAIVVKAEDLESFADMPDIAEKLAGDLSKVLGKFKGTSAPVIDHDAETLRLTQLVEARVAQERVAIEHKAALDRLADRHEDWEQVVGAPTQQTPFRTWLTKQGAAYETNVLQSWDARVTSKALDAFKAQAKKAVIPVPNDRAQRLAEAAPSRGNAPAPARARAKTDAEMFADGFNS